MKFMNLLFLFMFYINNIQAEQQYPIQDQPGGITIHIDASTQAQLPQTNQTNLAADHISKPSNNITTTPHTEIQQQNEITTIKLKPNESGESRFIRNGTKLGIAIAACYVSSPFAMLYGFNRFIVQPLLGNGSINTTISEKKQQKYREQGLVKEPDLNVFPIFEKIKNSR